MTTHRGADIAEDHDLQWSSNQIMQSTERGQVAKRRNRLRGGPIISGPSALRMHAHPQRAADDQRRLTSIASPSQAPPA